MRSRRLVLFGVTLCAAAWLLGSSTRAADLTLIASGSSWRYNATGTNLDTAWRSAGYSDAAWPSGLAELGYGDGDEITVIPYGTSTSNRYITSYFRRTFPVTNPASVAALMLRLKCDDGCVVYLNGTEIMRSNLPSGTISYSTLATTAIGGSDENAWHDVPVDPARLVAGANLIAVEVHQQSATSSDVTFDLELRATTDAAPPVSVTLTSPADGALVNGTSVTFRASATAAAGLSQARLLVGGVPQTIVRSGPAQVEDAQITADSPTVANGSGTSINVDGQAPHAHGLIRFPGLVGAGAGQVPAGAEVVSATLTLQCTNAGQMIQMYRLTEDWIEDQATWQQRASGVPWGSPGADGTASRAGAAVPGDCTGTGARSIDVTRFVQEWSDGATNHGLVLTDSGTDGIDFGSSESATPPSLAVVYRMPLASIATQSLSGTSATIEFPATLPGLAVFNWNIEVVDADGLVRRAPADFTMTADAAAPDEPVLISPADGAHGVDPSGALVARVSSPGGGAISATASLRVASGSEFTIIVLPDTQHYSEAFPGIFTTQTQWIVANQAARNIVFVTHEGDIVQNASADAEWSRANTSMSLLDAVVPYGMAPGNHDLPSTLYNIYFPFTRYLGLPWYGGHYQSNNDNNYQLFSGGGIDFVAVHLEWCPPSGAVAWAKSVFDAHPDRIGMMTTHGYLNESAQRTVGGCSNTQYLWDNLGAVTPNLHFMLSGHVHDESRRVDVANGHPVFQMLADYQSRPSGGEGWLRILRFVPAEDKVYVQTYSPWLNRFETDANSEFALDFTMSTPFVTSGAVVVPSGTDAAFQPAGLQPSTTYEWRVTATNDAGRSRTSPIWRFTTQSGGGGPVNQPPFASDATITLNEDATQAVTVSAGDPDGQPITYTLLSGPSHGTLSGALPSVSYQPASNFHGADAFTFRVSDGSLTSAVATITLAVNPVNDAPTAAAESYSVAAGNSLVVGAPGVLGNDGDVDGETLSTQLVSGPTNGVLSLGAAGGFSYTPDAGFAGVDSFSYRATDGVSSSATMVVTVNVTASTPVTILSAGFASGAENFSYLDNTFRSTTQSSYASGTWVSSGGFSGGALRIYLGGVNNNTVNGMSGGWRQTFTLAQAASLSLTFRYRLDQGPDYESDEYSQVLASLNGVLLGPSGVIAQVSGNGNGGASIDTGWRIVTVDLGALTAGTHTLTLGGYNNRKTETSERTTIWIDDVSVATR